MKHAISTKTVGRLSIYRRLLHELREEGVRSIYSHELAGKIGGTAAQVRRDLMVTGYSGSPKHGYDVDGLIASIRQYLDTPVGERVVLIGVGNLGRALLAFFQGRRPNVKIVAAFDVDPQKAGRVIHGCRCHGMDDLPAVVASENARVALLAVPAAEAQKVAANLVSMGVSGIVNFAPTPLHMPAHVFVENMDMTMALEKVIFFARNNQLQEVES